MSYIVTAMRQAPDIGFKAVSRHTAEGAKDLARNFVAEGLQEVEVRDDRGNLRTLQDLEQQTHESGTFETGLVKRLRAL